MLVLEFLSHIVKIYIPGFTQLLDNHKNMDADNNVDINLKITTLGGPNLGQNGPKSGPKLGFQTFSQVWFTSFS